MVFPKRRYLKAQNQPSVEYLFAASRSGEYNVRFYLAPTTPVCFERIQYMAFSINDGPMNKINTVWNEAIPFFLSEQWEDEAKSNIIIVECKMFCRKGENRMHFFGMSPGIVLEKIVIWDADITDKEYYINGFDDRALTQSGTKEAVRLLNKWYNMGLLWDEFALYKSGDSSGDAIQNSGKNIDYTITCNGVNFGDAELATLSINYGYSGIDPELVGKANDSAMRDGIEPKNVNVGVIEAEAGIGGILSEKRNQIYDMAVVAKEDEFDALWDQMMQEYLDMGGQAIIDERTAKWNEYFGDASMLP